MKTIRFEEMYLLSHKEKKGRVVHFHPKQTIIIGPNDTGKSSLVKSIYYTFGAVPCQLHKKWHKAEIIYAVKFSVSGNQNPYLILRHGDFFALFEILQPSVSLVSIANSVTKELGPILGGIFGFNLQLNTRSKGTDLATPAFAFLPFYIDQDSGWSENWSSFEHLSQFSSWRDDVVNYHAGVRGATWFELLSQNRSLQKEISTLDESIISLQLALSKLKTFTGSDFNMLEEHFQEDVDALLLTIENLQQAQLNYRHTLYQLNHELVVLKRQLDIVSKSKDELVLDFDFSSEIDDVIECPICGTEHSNRISDRFHIMKDIGQCEQLMLELSSEINSIEAKIAALSTNYDYIHKELQDLNTILSNSAERVELKDVLQNFGRQEIRIELTDEINAFEIKKEPIQQEINDNKESMNKLDNKKKRREITQFYKNKMDNFIKQLNVVNIDPKTYKQLKSKIKESGSDLPRALLAYYVSFLHVVNEYSDSVYFPFVVDSLNQQEQDSTNLKAMLRFLQNELPDNTQLIMAIVDDLDEKWEGDIVEMKEKASALVSAEYEISMKKLSEYVSLLSSEGLKGFDKVT